MAEFVTKSATLHSAAVAAADGSIMDVRGCTWCTVQIVGITTATITFKGRQDGSNYVALLAKNINSGAEATTATADGMYAVAVQGCTEFIADITAYTSGTITVTAVAGQGGVQMTHTSVAAIVGAVDTELPAAAALADNTANPTVPGVGSFGMVWDGATWDRSPGNSASGTKVQPATGGSGAADATTFRTISATDSPDVTALQIMDDWDNAASDGASVSGDVAHDAADAGEPLKIGGQARTTNPTAVADADRVNAMFDDVGRQVVVPHVVRDLITHATTTISASTTETTVLAAGAAGVFHDVLCVWVANTSGTAARLDFRDATAGTIRFSMYVPAGDMRGFAPPIPVTQASAANNWTAQSSASVTDLRVFVLAAKNV